MHDSDRTPLEGWVKRKKEGEAIFQEGRALNVMLKRKMTLSVF